MPEDLIMEITFEFELYTGAIQRRHTMDFGNIIDKCS